MRFSILIPVYKTPEDLFKRCIYSVLSQINDYGQKFLDYELVLVFDGNCTENQSLYNLAKELHSAVVYDVIEKSIVSAARNKCLELAQGDWIVWVDSDDTLQPFALNELEKVISQYGDNYDCFVYKANIFGDNLNYAKQMIDNYTFQGEMWFKEQLDMHKKVPEVLWRKCISRRFLDKYDINFDSTIKLYDDWYFHNLLMSSNPKCYKLSKALYNYYIRENSLSTNSDKENKRLYIYDVAKSLKKELLGRRQLSGELVEYLDKYCYEFCS